MIFRIKGEEGGGGGTQKCSLFARLFFYMREGKAKGQVKRGKCGKIRENLELKEHQNKQKSTIYTLKKSFIYF